MQYNIVEFFSFIYKFILTFQANKRIERNFS